MTAPAAPLRLLNMLAHRHCDLILSYMSPGSLLLLAHVYPPLASAAREIAEETCLPGIRDLAFEEPDAWVHHGGGHAVAGRRTRGKWPLFRLVPSMPPPRLSENPQLGLWVLMQRAKWLDVLDAFVPLWRVGREGILHPYAPSSLGHGVCVGCRCRRPPTLATGYCIPCVRTLLSRFPTHLEMGVLSNNDSSFWYYLRDWATDGRSHISIDACLRAPWVSATTTVCVPCTDHPGCFSAVYNAWGGAVFEA